MKLASEGGSGDGGRDDDGAPRAAIVAAVRRLDALGLNRGSSGNVSVRGAGGMWITPTGVGADDLTPDTVAWCGDDGTRHGAWQPSSEWPLHAAVYRARPDVAAIVHAHAAHVTALACLRRPLPAFHYMVAKAGGDDVPLVDYHLFGSDALGTATAAALADRDAALLANHGLVACGATLDQALALAVEVESLAQSYLLALAVGEPARLTAAEMAAVRERFAGYGRARRA